MLLLMLLFRDMRFITSRINEYVHRPDKDANILALVEPQCEWLREFGFEDVDCYFKIFELAIIGGRRPKK